MVGGYGGAWGVGGRSGGREAQKLLLAAKATAIFLMFSCPCLLNFESWQIQKHELD